ncbi:MAG: molecular chaperone DnaK (HSP70), partial [Oleiphilaceae bacterium]
ELANQYSHSSKTIDFIVKKLNISKSEALKEALLGFIGELGINLETPISIRELAVELHNCTTLTHQLFFIANSPDTILPTSDNDTTIEIDNTESEVTKIFAIDISLFSASLVVNDNGAITLLKVEDNYWIPSDSELKFRQAITELFLNFKSIADTYCKDGFYNVGLIIPSCFSSLQTLVIYDIVKSMEINYLFSTNRPVATAVAYYDDICTQDTTVICCDVRGGTIDMTILEVDQNDGYFTFEVLGKAGTFYDPQTNLRIKIIEILQQCLKDADMHADEINDLIVTGQHIDVQSVKSGLQDCIDKQAVKLIDSFITPLVGAVSKIAKCITGEMKNILILDVNNHSIGVETCDGSMLTILDRNTTIPTKQSSTVTTTQDNQTSMLIHIVEDKSCSTLNIASLGYFELTGIVPVSAGKAQIRITCDMDNEGVIKVTAEELGQLAFNTLTITSLEKELPSTPINLKAV